MTDLSLSHAVPVERLRNVCDPATLPFETTADVEPLRTQIGQDRATNALRFGVEISQDGFNIFITGAAGSGRRTTARGYLEGVAATRSAPDDWLYVHNFGDSYRPRAICLPAGEGCRFASRMSELVGAARVEIPKAFESDSYQRRKEHIVTRLQQRQQAIFAKVQEEAQQKGFAIESSQAGIATVPVIDGKPVTPEAFEQLPQEVKEDIARKGEEIRDRMEHAMRQGRKLEKESIERLRQLDREVALFAVGHLFEEIQQTYKDYPEVLEYLRQVQEDIPEQLDAFRGAKPDGQQMPPEAQMAMREEQFARYAVNIFVDNSGAKGAPVIEEYSPTYYNVMGRIEYVSHMGGMTTDFRQIRAGAIHRANGGYLQLEAGDLIGSPMVWESLKRALQTQLARVENLSEQMSPLPSQTLRPEPIPLSIKVVLIGSPAIYYLLYGQDEDFRKLFKVKADFAPDMDRSTQTVFEHAAFISIQVRRHGLRHFDRGAVARVVEHSSRIVEDQRRLTTQLSEISDLITEASFWAGKRGHEVVRAEDVQEAVSEKEYRSSLIAEESRRYIDDGTIMIDVDGAVVGQVNGLSVAEFGDFSFGTPTRITARTSPGSRGVLNVEREIQVSGPIHSKGVLILSGYLSGKYAVDFPLALSATLTFEQLYGGVEGDSASSTELYALLSSLSGLPIDQSIAVTGSVNQYGQVQAVGGVTDKIEGFFGVCEARGLTGRQGVVIPETNVKNLMLKDEVVSAVREGQFHIWSVRTVDEGIELLTRVPAGTRLPDGGYPEGTVHGRVSAKLREYAFRVREFGGGDGLHRVE